MNVRDLVTLTALLVLLVACSPGPAVSPSLDGTQWVLVSLQGSAPIEGTQITMNFEEASIDGSGGCNTYGGSYTASEDSLRLDGVYWTEMACMEPEGIMEQEQAYFQALNTVARYRLSGDRLEMFDEASAQILAFSASTLELVAEEEMPTAATPGLSLDCALELDETYPVGQPVNLRFELRNPTDHLVYVLTWYTPLEGLAGEIFRVTRDGEAQPYQGMLAKRGDPTPDEYAAIEPGEAAAAEVDLTMGYDLSAPGSYQVQFTAGLADVTDDASLVPRKRDDHQPQSLSCNAASLTIVPAPTAEPTETAPPPVVEPPAGFKQYQDSVTGISVYVPDSWTVIGVIPGEFATLQSYPENTTGGGGGQKPGNTKCDLTIRPPDIDLASHLERLKSNPDVTILSEREIVLQSGNPGIRFEVESMGRSLSLITEISERVVVLTCFGDLAPFDQIAVTLGASE